MSTDIADILDSLGIRISGESVSGRTGQLNYKAACPHHHCQTVKGPHVGCAIQVDGDPSWDINAETGLHSCHACGFKGSLEWLIHIVSGVPLAEAAKASGKGARALAKVKRIDPWAGERPIALPPMNEARIRMYGRPPEWAVAMHRLTQAAVEAYDVRWADPFIHGEKRVEHSRCWITPIRNAESLKAMGMQVKQEGLDRFFRNLPASVPKSSTLFGIETINDADKVYVVESPLDAAYLYSLGYKAVSSMGARVSADQMELLISRCSGIVLALDDDIAGRKATNELLGLNPYGRPNKRLQDYSKRFPIWLVNYAHGEQQKDVGDMKPTVARAVCDECFPASRLQIRRTR